VSSPLGAWDVVGVPMVEGPHADGYNSVARRIWPVGPFPHSIGQLVELVVMEVIILVAFDMDISPLNGAVLE